MSSQSWNPPDEIDGRGTSIPPMAPPQPNQFTAEAFDLPHSQRSQEFYTWREAILNGANQVIVSDDAKLAALAQEENFQELLADKTKEILDLNKKSHALQTDAESYQVGFQQMEA